MFVWTHIPKSSILISNKMETHVLLWLKAGAIMCIKYISESLNVDLMRGVQGIIPGNHMVPYVKTTIL